MNRNTSALIIVAAVSLLAGFGLFQLTGSKVTEAKIVENRPTPLSAIPFSDLDGQDSVLGDWRQPILIINFWAPWCAPCRREIPALVEIQKEYSQKLQVLGLALDSIENVQSFSIEHNMNYPSFIAGSNIPMYNAAFSNKSGSLPHTAIIDQQRNLAYFHTGEITSQMLREKINELL